jgi:tRNA(Ile)-lysidine synthase
MITELENYLKDACNCNPNGRFLLTVSGGIDSVVLAHIFYKGGHDFALAHCNFQLRGEESDGDQRFVEELAIHYGKPCFVKRFDTQSLADEKGLSIQMAARELRYSWFAELAGNEGYDYIVVAHNRNDVIETVLLNFSRGTGIRGLTGIKPRVGNVIRPLLFATRQKIALYARENNLTWREDSSNSTVKYKRNRIRHNIIPEFKMINPSFIQSAADTIERLAQTEQMIDYLLDEVKRTACTTLPDRFLIHFEKLRTFPANESLLFELLRPYGCNRLDIKSLMDSLGAAPGKRFITLTHTITRDRQDLIVTRNRIHENQEVLIDSTTACVLSPVYLIFHPIASPEQFVIPTEPRYAALDADKLHFPLILRQWKPGDRFCPLGLNGSKKVSDYLINSKIPLPDKQEIMVLESRGAIAWLVNLRIDERFKVTPQTRNILLIECKMMVENEGI